MASRKEQGGRASRLRTGWFARHQVVRHLSVGGARECWVCWPWRGRGVQREDRS